MLASLLPSSCDAIKGKGDDTVKEEGKETGEEERGEERKKVVHMKKMGKEEGKGRNRYI